MATALRRLPGQFDGEILDSAKESRFTFAKVGYPVGHQIPRHSHENSLISFVLRGGFTEVSEQRRRQCRTSAVLFNPGGQEHQLSFGEAGATLFTIDIEPGWLQRMQEYPLQLDLATDVRGGKCAWHAARLYSEFIHRGAASPLVFEALVLALLGELLWQADAGSMEKRVPRWLHAAKDLLHARFAESLTLSGIASTVGVHPVYLASKFREHFRSTIGDYVRQLRVEFAQRELRAGTASLSEIAASSGFADQAHFSRTFKHLTGMTPLRYRREICRL